MIALWIATAAIALVGAAYIAFAIAMAGPLDDVGAL